MTTDPFPDPSSPSSRVLALFAGFLESCEAGDPPDFDALCSDYPVEASDLRRLHEEWRRLQAALRAAREGTGSFATRLKRRYGEGADPTVQLDAAPSGSAGAATEELVRRLAQHAPTTSRYKLEGEVDRGGMGAILKVWDEDLRRHLAMKVVLGKGQGASTGATPPVDRKELARFLEEAQVTGQLDHPGIVPVHELGLDSDGRVYFTMKLVKGRDLKWILDLVFGEKEGWNETRALGVILKVCEAMAYAHDKGVIHRDLKPANVMVGNFGEVFVMDWGLARVLGRKDSHDIRIDRQFPTSVKSVKTERRDEREETPDSPLITMDGDVMGTPAYMPPEQARGEIEKLTPRSDVYAIGAMLYHLIARQMPYAAPGTRLTNRTVLALVQQGPPTPLASLRTDVPAELVAICEKAMAREAKDRYADTLALAEDLRAYLEHRVVGAYETGAWAEARKWVSRNKRLAAASVVSIVAILFGVITPLQIRAHSARRELLFSDARLASDLVVSMDVLGWSRRDDLDGLHSWLRDADALAARRGEHDELLRDLEADPAASVRAIQMRELIRKTAPAVAALRPILIAHEEFARTIEERSIAAPEARRLWDPAIATIAASSIYNGLKLTPQLGLLPIGQDPESHLWEFAHLQTGEPAQRGVDGNLVLNEETGLVLVLIPGGTFWMGAQGADENGHNFDEQASPNEFPPQEVTLSAFLMSKYEMTQAQWLRIVRNNPSLHAPGTKFGDKTCGLSNPVEQVSWNECTAVLSRLGLVLPTEAQWEYAARAGKDFKWWTGNDPHLMNGAANLADADGKANGGPDGWAYEPWLHDGWTVHAPVGSYRANAFGLRDVIGNVLEWCRDGFGGYDLPVRTGDGERQVPNAASRIFRGGAFNLPASFARSAFRGYDTPVSQNHSLGLRPARAITP